MCCVAEFPLDGDPNAIIQACWSTGVNDKLVIPGVTALEETTNLQLFLLPLHQKSILGSAGSTCAPVDIPWLADMLFQKDLLKLDNLITKKLKLEQINEVVEAMTKGQNKGRWVCELD